MAAAAVTAVAHGAPMDRRGPTPRHDAIGKTAPPAQVADGADEPVQRTAATAGRGALVPRSGVHLGENVPVRGRAGRVAATVAAVFAGALAGCSSPAPEPGPTGAATPTGPAPASDRELLAGLAAAAKDNRYIARYTLTATGRPDRTVTVALGTDGSWVVAVPAGALSGLADVAIYSPGDGLYQCSLGPASGTAGSRPDLGPITPGCTAVKTLTPATDPQVQHIFTDWIDPLVDRATALSVTAVEPLPGASGACFSVESNSAALAPPVDPGVYCYEETGLLTAARVGFGTLLLDGEAAPPPATVAMPAPQVSRAPLPISAPPPPPPPSPSPTQP